jgi:hypothetical protein
MRSSRVVRASDCHVPVPKSQLSCARSWHHSGILGAADEALLNKVLYIKKYIKNPPVKIFADFTLSGLGI